MSIEPDKYPQYVGVRPSQDDRPAQTIRDLLLNIVLDHTDEELARLAAWFGSKTSGQIAAELTALINLNGLQDPALRPGFMLRVMALDPNEDPRDGQEAKTMGYVAAEVMSLLTDKDQTAAIENAKNRLVKGKSGSGFDKVARAALKALGGGVMQPKGVSPLLAEALQAGPSPGEQRSLASQVLGGAVEKGSELLGSAIRDVLARQSK